MEELNKRLDELITYIKDSEEYQKCILLKKRMNNNKVLMDYIRDVKKLQKEYVRSGYQTSIKEELDLIEKKLYDNPLYVVYLQNLEIVNYKIDYVKDVLNDYFFNLMNGYN